MPIDLDALWDFQDPAGSEGRFRSALELADEKDRAEALTQLARSLGLQRRFDEAHATLDQAAAVLEAGSRAEVRYMLERGRVLNSSGGRIASRQVFHQALAAAQAAGEDALAVDAAHMIAIVEDGDESLRWNRKAIEMAESSSDPKARRWLASLLNNTGWTLFDQGRYEEALDLFQRARRYREENGQIAEERIARWCIGRCLRAMEQFEEALALQSELAAEAGDDGFVQEELAELHAQAGRLAEAATHATAALATLASDPWFAENEAIRLDRLRRLANSEGHNKN